MCVKYEVLYIPNAESAPNTSSMLKNITAGRRNRQANNVLCVLINPNNQIDMIVANNAKNAAANCATPYIQSYVVSN